MAKKLQCEQCDAFINERGLCRKNWEPVVYDDIECELFDKEKAQFKTEVQEVSQIRSQDNKKDNNRQSVITVSDVGISHMLDIARWTKFLAIVAVIGMAFMVLGAISIIIMAAKLGEQMVFVGIFYILLIAIYFYPVKKAFDLASHMKNSALMTDSGELEFGLGDLRSILRYLGILTIIILAFYGLALILFIFAGIGAGIASVMN
jgi:hypothetical protein